MSLWDGVSSSDLGGWGEAVAFFAEPQWTRPGETFLPIRRLKTKQLLSFQARFGTFLQGAGTLFNWCTVQFAFLFPLTLYFLNALETDWINTLWVTIVVNFAGTMTFQLPPFLPLKAHKDFLPPASWTCCSKIGEEQLWCMLAGEWGLAKGSYSRSSNGGELP